jgi:transcriptional regulator with XRE-family HTH domain
MPEFLTEEETGARVRELRKEAGLNQEELGKVIGADQTTISKIEGGLRALTARELMLLAEYFQVTTASLVTKEMAGFALRAGEAADEGVEESWRIFRDCIEDFHGLHALAR